MFFTSSVYLSKYIVIINAKFIPGLVLNRTLTYMYFFVRISSHEINVFSNSGLLFLQHAPTNSRMMTIFWNNALQWVVQSKIQILMQLILN